MPPITPTLALPVAGDAAGTAVSGGTMACTGRTAPPNAFTGVGVVLMGRQTSLVFALPLGGPSVFGVVLAREFHPAAGLVLTALRPGSAGSCERGRSPVSVSRPDVRMSSDKPRTTGAGRLLVARGEVKPRELLDGVALPPEAPLFQPEPPLVRPPVSGCELPRVGCVTAGGLLLGREIVVGGVLLGRTTGAGAV